MAKLNLPKFYPVVRLTDGRVMQLNTEWTMAKSQDIARERFKKRYPDMEVVGVVAL